MKITQKALEQKIKSVNKIAKITKAMKLIATLRFQKLAQKLPVLKQLLADWQTILHTFNFKNQKPKLPLQEVVILFTSDLGLCGSYNSVLFKALKNHPQAIDKLLVIGRKGITHFNYIQQRMFLNVHQGHFQDPTVQTTWLKWLTDACLNQNVKITVFYQHPYSRTDFRICKLILWPLNQFNVDLETNLALISKGKVEIVFEPQKLTILKHQIHFYLANVLKSCGLFAQITEFATRQIMMENATENAERMVDELKLEHNQIRQEKITNEILEINQN